MDPLPAPRAPGPRRPWPFYALTAVILLALPAGFYAFLGRAEPAPAASAGPPPEAALAPAVRIARLDGPVELRQADGSWAPARQGDVLDGADAVRTLDGAAAVLTGDVWEVRMEAGTEVSVEELTESISRLLLYSGMAVATVRGGARHTFEVRAAGADAVARTSGGAFAITSNGTGTVAVGAREGEVAFSGAGKAVIVRAGQQSLVQPGAGPSDPAPVPASLLLKVKWPERSLLTSRRLVVAGQTAPGAQIEVAGRVVRAGADGRFSQPVLLAEGRNALKVRAIGVGGAKATSDADIRVDTRDPTIGIDPDLWKRE